MTVTHERRWTDERTDDLNKKVDVGFEKVDKRFDQVDERFEKVEGKIENGLKGLRGEMNGRFEAVDKRFDKARDEMKNEVGGLRVELMALHRLLLRASIGGGVAITVLLFGRLTGHL